jgi:hypothetical protein
MVAPLDVDAILKIKLTAISQAHHLHLVRPVQTLLKTLDLQRQQPRIVPTHGKIATVEPEARMSALLPDRPHLAFLIETPNITDLVRDLIAKDRASLRAHILVPSGENDLVGFQLTSIGKLQGVRKDLIDLLALFDLDLTRSDELRRADVDVVAAASLEILDEETRAVRPAVGSEPRLFQAREHFLVVLGLQAADLHLQGFEDWRREAVEQDVRFVDLRAVFVEEAF